MTTIYKQDRNHQNWTGRVPRQSRITGYWSQERHQRTPASACVIGVIALIVLFAAAYL